MTLLELHRELAQGFAAAHFQDPTFESRHLLTELLRLDSAQLMIATERPLTDAEIETARSWAKRRASGEPLAYLCGHRGFYKADFLVQPGVLVPRPESEMLVDLALKFCKTAPALIMDLGCGSGCIGLSLIQEWWSSQLVAVDQSAVACEVTRLNAQKLVLSARVQIVQTAVENFTFERHPEVIVANPPYIAVGDDRVEPGVHRFEPAEALYAGADGLDAIRAWSLWAAKALAPQGLWLCEIGAEQARVVTEILSVIGFKKILVHKDLAGKDRVVSARKGE